MIFDTLSAHVEIEKKSLLEMMDRKCSAQSKHFFTKIKEWKYFLSELKWFNIIVICAFHLGALYSLFSLDLTINIKTIIWYLLICTIQAMGFTAGAHRFWTHRTYKAKFPLKIILLICYVTAGQVPLRSWVRDHRIHHKYTDTDADPHNINRGFFFSHVGWLMMKKHPKVIDKGRQIDLSDLDADPVAVFCDKYFWTLNIIFSFIIPLAVPVYGWHETWSTSLKIFSLRSILGLNSVWSVNSFAHMWGTKPYNTNITPTNNKIVSLCAYGEGWHNYHHVFPWDYKTDEFGDYKLNFTTLFIDFFAKIGWAYDLRQPSKELVKSVMMKKGENGNHDECNVVPHL